MSSRLSEALGVDPAANLPGALQPGQVTDDDLARLQAFAAAGQQPAQAPGGLFPGERAALAAIPAPQTPFSLMGMAKGAGTGMLDLMELGQTATRPEDIPPSAALAVPLVGGAVGAALAPRMSVGVFGGRLAKLAPPQRAISQNALEMGADPKQVLRASGWFRGADGRMRFEIDDSQSLATSRFNQASKGLGEVGSLETMLHHPTLFEQYPHLKGLRVRFQPDRSNKGFRGSFDPSTGEIVLNPMGRTPSQIKSTLLHEVQHAVQEMEEFARGGTPERMQQMLKARGRADLADTPGKAQQAYRQLAGEVEARLTQARETLDIDARRRIAPFLPEHVRQPQGPLHPHQESFPRHQQVVLGTGRTRRGTAAANPAPAALPGILGTGGPARIPTTQERAAILRGDLL